MPLVSVLIPTFKRDHVLERAINSVLSQTVEDLECIVIDDAPSGETKELVLRKAKEDSRLKFIQHTENKGVSAARNTGFQLTTGKWIALLDSDDEWLPKKLEKQLEFCDRDPNIRLIHGEEIWIRNGKRVNQKKVHQKSGGRIFSRCLHLCLISPSATMMKRELYQELQGFREDYPVCEDYEMWLRVTAKEEVGYVKDPIINKYGGHEDQLSAKFKAMDYWRVKAIDETLMNKQLVANLSEEELQEARNVLKRKCEILLAGYRKHENLDPIPFIEELLERHLN